MSDSVQPHRLQPTRLPHPWDPPGKNTGVGCHFLLQCMKVKSESEVVSVMSDSLRPHGPQPTRLLHPWDFPGKSTGEGCHCLLRLEWINGFKKVAGYKINIQNSIAFLYTSNKQSKDEIKKIIPFMIPSIKHLGIKFNKRSEIFSRHCWKKLKA